MSTAVTQGLRITVQPRYLENQSIPLQNRWVFAYTVTIANEGNISIRIMSRHWIISDGNGNEEHVRGQGIAGRQPVLRPGDTHEYTSFCPLPTPLGMMRGSYRVMRMEGGPFEAEIAPFTLAAPKELN